MLALIQIIFIGWIAYETIPKDKETATVQKIQEKIKAKNIEVKVKRDFLETKQGECGTEIMEIWVDQIDPRTGKPLETCRGKLLVEGQVTRVIKKYGKGK